MPPSRPYLRVAGLLSILAGLGISLALMFAAGRRQPSIFLMVLFTLWVASPFVGLGLADRFSHRFPGAMGTPLYVLMVLIAAGSLAFYTNVIPMPEGAKTAAVYLMVPLASWVLITLMLGVATRSGRGTERVGS